jgi:HAT1-interacting factor 1
LIDLRGPVITVSNGGPAGAPAENPLSSVFAQFLGESPAEQKAKLEEATKNANDLSGLVRHKKKPKPAPAVSNGTSATETSNGNGKRKLEDVAEGEVEGKKAKVEG